MIHDATYAAERIVKMVKEQEVVSLTGKRVPVRVDTICVHGDSPSAVAMATEIRKALAAENIAIRPMADFIN